MRAAFLGLALLLALQGAGGAVWAAPPTLASARKGLASGEPAKRQAAAAWLARTGGAQAVSLLRPALRDPDRTVRELALTGVARHHPQPARILLAHLADETDPGLSAHALDLIGRTQDSAVAPDVAAHLSHAHRSVRCAALVSLGVLDRVAGRRAAMHVLGKPPSSDPGWRERGAALLVLAEVGARDDFFVIADTYREGGGPACWFARSCFARVLARLRPQDAIEQLTALAGDVDGRVGATAGKALADLGPPGHRVLASLLSHDAARVRIAAIAGVFQGNLRRAQARLRTLARLDPDHGVRWAATHTLWTFDDESADDFVLEATRAKEPVVRMAAYRLLEERLGVDHGTDLGAWRSALAARRAKMK